MNVPVLSPTGWLSIQAAIDGVDHLAVEMERKWGVGRLRLLVPVELREKFDRQQRKFGEAVNGYDVAEATKHGGAMERAWRALDAAAAQAGAQSLAPVVWEAATEDGRVIAIVRLVEEAHAVTHDGRYVEVWSLDEIVRVLKANPTIGKAKEVFPGARVVAAYEKPEPDWTVGDSLEDLIG